MLRKHLIINKNLIKHFTTKVQTKKVHKEKWKSVVGLEVHAQIASASKLFSGSSTDFGEPLNSAVSPFDASVPGTLPVLNRKCVEMGIRTALALSCQVNEVSMFDRKHYFYADLPAGYQITQQRAALANNGQISFPVIVPGKKVYYKKARLLQLQLEQDSGKSLHDDVLKRSLVDLNRAGVPLMELVFAPDLETGEEAASLVKELIITLCRLETCSCKMEEGALRVDANISVHKENEPLGVRTEVKNIGSVRSISQAITYEIKRQIEIVTRGGTITNETRSWDADERCTVAMRDKEVLQDYRFMPEPNLPPLRLNMKQNTFTANDDTISVYDISAKLPELPEHTRQCLVDTYKLSQDMAIILVNEPTLLAHFRAIVDELPSLPSKLVSNFLVNDLLTFCNKTNIDVDQCQVTSRQLKDILNCLHSDEINLQSARHLIELVNSNPSDTVEMLIADHDLKQITDTVEIEKLCQQAIKNQPKSVQQYKSGKSKALFAVVGEVARLSHQKANMKAVASCIEKLLKDK